MITNTKQTQAETEEKNDKYIGYKIAFGACGGIVVTVGILMIVLFAFQDEGPDPNPSTYAPTPVPQLPTFSFLSHNLYNCTSDISMDTYTTSYVQCTLGVHPHDARYVLSPEVSVATVFNYADILSNSISQIYDIIANSSNNTALRCGQFLTNKSTISKMLFTGDLEIVLSRETDSCIYTKFNSLLIFSDQYLNSSIERNQSSLFPCSLLHNQTSQELCHYIDTAENVQNMDNINGLSGDINIP